MNILLDTHALLWWLDDEATLSREARDVIADATNPVFLSAAVIWEIRIKQRLGKIELPENFREVLDEQQFQQLDITHAHAHAVQALPLHHRDPFDRMLIAQAQVEDLTLITRDPQIQRYKVAILLAGLDLQWPRCFN